MYLEYFNGCQQLDLDTNLDKSTSSYLVDVHEKRDTLLGLSPTSQSILQKCKKHKLNAHLWIQVSVVQQCKILETGSHISSNYGFH